jgi:class III poly(R)-hydroxyalkanoic acid synthase PhaE subunit
MGVDMTRGADGRTSDWTELWYDAQRAALEQWLGRGDTQAGDLLKTGMDRWWQLWGGQAERTPRDTGERLRSIGEQYLKGFQQVWMALGGPSRDPTGADFQNRLQQTLLDLASGRAGQEFWSNLLPGFSGAAAPAGAADWSRALAEAGSEPWKLLFSVPPLGPSRGLQAELTEFNEALLSHQRLVADWTGILANVHHETLRLLAARVAEKAQGGEPIQSFRALYDEWIGCGEAAFAEAAHGAEYARLQGALGDSDARLRVMVRGLVERWLRSVDLPTRSELDTAHRRIRDLGRRLEDAERRHASDMASLREEIAALSGRPAARRPGTSRKKAPAARRRKPDTTAGTQPAGDRSDARDDAET